MVDVPTDVDAARGPRSLWSRIDRGDLIRTLVVAACAVMVAAGLTWPSPAVPVVAVAGLAVGCWPILVEAWEDVRHRRMSMETSMLIAIAAAAAIGDGGVWQRNLNPRHALAETLRVVFGGAACPNCHPVSRFGQPSTSGSGRARDTDTWVLVRG